MIYRPSYGKMKDNFIFRHKGMFYMYSMFTKDINDLNDGYNNVWMAKSPDGLHWEDVGPVVEDFPTTIYAPGAVHEAGGRFYLNCGGFSEDGIQNRLKFWVSDDLEHWEYMGEEYDIAPFQIGRPKAERLDHMGVLKHGDMYYGYAKGPNGFLTSQDGIHWQFCEDAMERVDFRSTSTLHILPSRRWFETSGCQEINGNFYLLGGWDNYMGNTGYGTYTLVSDSPDGPFSPDTAAYRLSGHSHRSVNIWARFCQTDEEVLCFSYMDDGYETESHGFTWLPPLKKCEVDMDHHLRLAYWHGNDALIGEKIDISSCPLHRYTVKDNQMTVTEEIFDSSVSLKAKELNKSGIEAARKKEDPNSKKEHLEWITLDKQLLPEEGVIITGTFQASHKNTYSQLPSVGFLLEETPASGSMIWLHGRGLTEIGYYSLDNGYTFTVEDVIAPGCAAPTGFEIGEFYTGSPHTFRLFIKKNMFEFYLDDRYVQSFNTHHYWDARAINPNKIGFAVRSGMVTVSNLEVHKFSFC